MALITLSSGQLTASVNPDNQQLVSLKLGDKEYFHGGGLPKDLQHEEDQRGWAQSEIVMFPVVGPSRENRIFVNSADHPMAQHGIARYQAWSTASQSKSAIRFVQKYSANSDVQTGRIKEASTWPFSYELERTYELAGRKLSATFIVRNKDKHDMPFMLGWHPAFKLPTDDAIKTVHISLPELDLHLDEVRHASKKGAYNVHASEVSYTDVEKSFTVRSDMGKFMLWTPEGSSLLCIEPVTDFQDVNGLEQFPQDCILLKPGDSMTFTVEIEIEK